MSNAGLERQMSVRNVKELEAVLKEKYDLAVGANSLKAALRKMRDGKQPVVKISGRSYTTGKRKAVKVSLE